MPVDTVVPPGAVVLLPGSCQDTSSHGSGSTNTYVAPGDVSALPSTGRDPSLITQAVEVGGRSAVQVIQSKPDFNIGTSFLFDTTWAHHSVVAVNVYIEPSQMVGTAWPGTLKTATFDGTTWLPLDTAAGSNDSLAGAVGVWKTIRFKYDPSRYTIGRWFDLFFLANGHGNGSSNSSLQWNIGAVWVEGAGTQGTDTAQTPAIVSGGLSMDSLSRLMTCNQCQVVHDGNRTAISVVPNGGGVALSFEVVVDSVLWRSKTLSFDLKSEFALGTWEQAWFMVDNQPDRSGWDEYRTSIPQSTFSGWGPIQIPFNGSLYRIGSTARFLLSLNANPPSGKRMFVDNLRWTP